MSLLSNIKMFLKRYLKNPVVVAAGAYLIWRFLNKHLKKGKKENWKSERITIVEDDDKKNYSLIYDDRVKKFILVYNDRVFSSDKKEDLLKLLK